MSISIDDRFAGGFVIEAEGLRGLVEKIEGRLKRSNIEAATQFKVYRADPLVYTTTSVEEVLAEPNDAASRILRVELQIRSTVWERLNATLSFSREKYRSGAAMELGGEDKDEVFLLTQELRSFIEKKFMRRQGPPSAVRIAFAGLFGPVSAYWVQRQFERTVAGLPDKVAVVTAAMRSADLRAKLDALLMILSGKTAESGAVGSAVVIGLATGIAAALVGYAALPWFVGLLWPVNIFAIGGEANRLTQLKVLRGALLAIGLGVIAGLILLALPWR